MRDYRAARASAASTQGELHAAIEQVARAACDQDDARLETLFLDLQARITEDLDALLAAFPRGDATASVVLMLLQTVSVQRAIPARASAPAVDPEALRMRVFELLTRLHV